MNLTREQIMNAEAGRTLDAWVCEYIFGWRRITGPKTDYDGPCEFGDVLIPPTIVNDEEAFRMMPPKGEIPLFYFVHKNYSTDIADAFEMEKKMLDKSLRDDYGFELYRISEADETCGGKRNLAVFKIAHASPEQRCKAALLTLLEGSE